MVNKYLLAARRIRISVLPLVLVLALFTVLSWHIIRPLAIPLLWSMLFSYFAFPFFKFLHIKVFGGRYRNGCAAITTAVILLFMALPLSVVFAFVVREAVRVGRDMLQSGFFNGTYREVLLSLKDAPFIGELIKDVDTIAELPVVDALMHQSYSVLTALVALVSTHVFEGVVSLLLVIMVVAITAFFLVRDGQTMINFVKDLLPMPENDREAFMSRIRIMIRAVVFGVIMTAAVQGTMGAIGWWYVGLPHPAFFGFCMFLTAMVPFVGTPAIWLPGSIFLFLGGHYTNAAILFFWGLLVVSMIDNFIKPYFIAEGSNIHMLLVFVGLIGGLYAWGFLGVFMGPLVLSLSLFLLVLYHRIINSTDSDFTKEKLNGE